MSEVFGGQLPGMAMSRTRYGNTPWGDELRIKDEKKGTYPKPPKVPKKPKKEAPGKLDNGFYGHMNPTTEKKVRLKGQLQ